MAKLDLNLFAPAGFEMEWPPRSDRRECFPEIDCLEYPLSWRRWSTSCPPKRPLFCEGDLQPADATSGCFPAAH